jgi:DNA-binding response OmpR family regulator
MKTVLIVDDSATMRAVLKLHLSQISNICVQEAVNGRDALEKKRTVSPDLIVTDITMPEMDGLELLDKIRSTSSKIDLPVIIISSHDEEMHVLRGLKAGANDYLHKPVDARLLNSKIRYYLHLPAEKHEEAIAS